MASVSTREKREYKAVASSDKFHSAVRAVAGLEGKTMIEICDILCLPLVEKRLARLKTGKGKAQ